MDRVLVLDVPAALLEQRKTSSSARALPHSPIPLLSIPTEITTEVFRLLTVLDRTHLALTCKQLAAYACLPGVLNLNPNLGQDSDRTLIKTDDSFLPLRLDFMYDSGRYRSWYFSFNASKTWSSMVISSTGIRWNRIVERHLRCRYIKHTKGLAELIVARKNITMEEPGDLRDILIG